MSRVLDATVSEAMTAAAEVLAAGAVVGLPTETAYVLAVDPLVAGTSDRLFTILKRPRNLDLTVLVASVAQAERFATALTEEARRLMDRCWPGPLTLVLPRNPDLPADLGDDELTVGVRMPDAPAPRSLCTVAGPVAAATATAGPGGAELRTASAVADGYGELVSVVLDGGPCAGVPVTVVDATGTDPHLIREGPVSWDEVLEALKA